MSSHQRSQGEQVREMIDSILQSFGKLLSVRLQKGVYTTEDSVRYTFFAALNNVARLNPEDIIIEYPHPTIKRAMIDTYVPRLEGETLAVEFKYDRQIPSGKNMPRPQKAGALLRDVARLSRIHDPNKLRLLFVYLTDSEMAAYLSNPANGLADFFLLKPGRNLTVDHAYLAPRSAK